MRGAVAAGHPLTAEAGAEVLAQGGNAVDACIAAAFVSWVAESPLTGPGAGGFMLVHRASDNSTRVLDHFVTVPGLGLRRRDLLEMESVAVAFTPESSQVFRIGAASCAVPGAVAGLGEAHRLFGSLPWNLLLEPAIRRAREGVVVTKQQAYLHAILDLILRHTREARAIYGEEQRLLAGDRLVMEDLAGTLEQLAERGAADFYRGELARRISSHLREQGGAITRRDLAEYRVIRRRPVRVSFLGHEFESNPPPSTGGILIGLGVRLLDRLGAGGAPGSAEAIASVVEIMREQEAARDDAFSRDLYRGGLGGRLYDPRAVGAAVRRLRRRLPEALRGTTHISIVDGRGNAASLTASTGSGSGVVVPGTGIQLNNMLGEFDLARTGRVPRPGVRFTSGMAPTLVLREGRPRLVVGSAGSLRLRGAIFQIVVNVVGHGLGVEEAIDRPRVHLEEPHVHCEGGHDPAELDRLAELGYELVRWRRRNLFFGGASGVEFRADGALAAAGDPRRGGHGVVVE
ncbi:MAG TPA: gamma-glutamyltransferase [Candidatus Limnocylindria bacterium]|nr:gamma-glutamyltransferase [Candidatus Limnocylindria bacterium]